MNIQKNHQFITILLHFRPYNKKVIGVIVHKPVVCFDNQSTMYIKCSTYLV